MENKKVLEEDEYLNHSDTEEADFEGEVDADDIFQWDTFNYSTHGSVTNMDIDSLIHSLGDGGCAVPGFQRKFVWTREKVSGLAFSIIKGIPVPPLYVYFDEEEGVEYILDGQQRVTAIFLYYLGLYYQNENKRKKINFQDVYKTKLEIKDIEEKKQKEKLTASEKEALKKSRDYLKNKYGLVDASFAIKDHSGNKHDITFLNLKENEQRILKRKSIPYAVVECAKGDSPQKFYTMVFKMLNSGGKTLGPQEIRNGLHWKDYLYKQLMIINEEEDSNWRKIYGEISLYSKDTELLLKMMALNYYSKTNASTDSINIVYDGTFNWSNIMNSFSALCKSMDNKLVEAELEKLRTFLGSINMDGDSKKCKKAALEAVYVCCNKLGIIDQMRTANTKINMSWIISLSEIDDIFGKGKVLSNKDSVEKRITKTLAEVRNKYGKFD